MIADGGEKKPSSLYQRQRRRRQLKSFAANLSMWSLTVLQQQTFSQKKSVDRMSQICKQGQILLFVLGILHF